MGGLFLIMLLYYYSSANSPLAVMRPLAVTQKFFGATLNIE